MAGKRTQKRSGKAQPAQPVKARGAAGSGPASSSPSDAYELKIVLLGSEPPIWRRFIAPADIHLDRLHDVIQAVMGWTNSHLHQFVLHGTRGSQRQRMMDAVRFQPRQAPDGYLLEPDDDRDMRDTATVTLRELLKQPKDRIVYEYDFGDSWEHEIELERVISSDSPGAPALPKGRRALPAVCLEGKLACPPDDCGGIPGYYDMLEAIKDPRRESHADMIEWLGEKFDPECFDLSEVNKALAGKR